MQQWSRPNIWSEDEMKHHIASCLVECDSDELVNRLTESEYDDHCSKIRRVLHTSVLSLASIIYLLLLLMEPRSIVFVTNVRWLVMITLIVVTSLTFDEDNLANYKPFGTAGVIGAIYWCPFASEFGSLDYAALATIAYLAVFLVRATLSFITGHSLTRWG